MLKMNFKKLNEKAITPTYGTEFSAGADLYACEGGEVSINPGETKLIHAGLCHQKGISSRKQGWSY